MQPKQFLGLAVAATAVAQSDRGNGNLTEALNSQNTSLSVLNNLLASQPDLAKSLGSTNFTFLAPNNQAMNRFLGDNPKAASDTALLTAVLKYHSLNGTYQSHNFTHADRPLVIPTHLKEPYSTVHGGQRVEAMHDGAVVHFTSGGASKSVLLTPNVNFTGGMVHIIDSVLDIPPKTDGALQSAGLTSLADSLRRTNLLQGVLDMGQVTIFAPQNAAFDAVGNVLARMNDAQLAEVLKYHVISDAAVYGDAVRNGTIAKTVHGDEVRLTLGKDGSLFVNSARVIKANVLVSNGVVHVIDGVLNPENNTATPDPTAATQSPAFTGATSTPYAGPQPTGGAAEGQAPGVTGAIGVVALLSGVVLLANL